MTITLSALQKQRRDTAANWTAENPTLLAGELGLESDTGYWKVGDGSTAWTSLAYVSGLGGEIPVSRLADGAAGQIIQTDAAGTGVEWSSTTNLPLGTAAAPAYRFQGDSNTGIYSPGADQVAVATNGSGRLFINSAGQVGIGTSGQNRALVVSSTDSEQLVLNSTTGSLAGIFFNPNGSTYTPFFGATGESLVAHTQGLERLRITSTGLVGIGTSSPQASTQIRYPSTAPSLSTNTGAGLALDGTSTVQINFGTNPSSPFNGWIQTRDTGTNAAWPLAINPLGGNVGIGTTSPSHLLDVVGNIAVSQGSRFYLTNNSGFSPSITNLADANSMQFYQANTERMRIDSSGRLLVGTSSSPTGTTSQYARLTVLGNTNSSTGYGSLNIGLGSYTATPSGEIGRITFTNNGGADFARIQAFHDGAMSSDNDCPAALVFSTTADGASSPTERMRIKQNGEIGTFSGSEYPLVVRSSNAAGTTNKLFTGTYSATNTTNGTVSFQVLTNGNVQNTNNSYGAISDIKLKENIVDANSQWSDLKALQVRNYNFKEGQTHTQIGLVAQEVELVSPGLVSESPDRDEEGNDLGTVTKSVNYSVLYMKAVKALQEAMERIETLEGMVAVNNITIDEQQHQLSTLAARLTALESA